MVFPHFGRRDISTERILLPCYTWYVMSWVFVWYVIRVLLPLCVTDKPEKKESQTWNIVHCCACAKVCTLAGMVLTQQSTPSVMVHNLWTLSTSIRFRFSLYYWFTLLVWKYESPLEILTYQVVGDVRLACTISTDGLVEMENIWSNANDVLA